MPFRRRRPLLRAAAVGGTAYAAGKHGQRKQQEAADQEARLEDVENQQAAAPPADVPQQASAAQMTEGERVSALKDLKELLDSGVINLSEFEKEKTKLLG